VKKGRPIYVEGRLKYGKYTDQSGVERNTVDIVASELQLLGSREGMGAPTSDDGSAAPRAAAPAASRPAPSRPAAAKPAAASTDFDGMEDDIPF
jgi:single-strand DNA-binding protein